MRTDDIRTLDWIPAEEDWLLGSVRARIEEKVKRYPVQAHNVVVALSCVELDGEATGITSRVRELPAKSDSGEANEDGSLGPCTLQEARFAAPR